MMTDEGLSDTAILTEAYEVCNDGLRSADRDVPAECFETVQGMLNELVRRGATDVYKAEIQDLSVTAAIGLRRARPKPFWWRLWHVIRYGEYVD